MRLSIFISKKYFLQITLLPQNLFLIVLQGKNLHYLTYKKIFFDYNKYPDPNNKDYMSEKDLKKYLEYCLKNKLNNPKSIFNAYNTNTITILVCILWFFIIVQAFNILFYYYRDIYSYILLFTTILIILIAIIWKMIYILNVNN